MNGLPRLLDCRALAAELGVKRATAENIMRQLPKVPIGRRIYVTDESVRVYLKSSAKV